MFTVYKKITTPETSPVLGPANATPRESPTITPKEDPQTSEPTPLSSNMEPFSLSLSLCNYCCSSRLNPDHKPDPKTKTDLNQDQYEFGHATHYTYHKHSATTTPRMICEFETGTPP
uniref:Uncharacterized protein n=1 Tax=viral metagenome TaxID=1070528 RepID=A0A6C0I499_9ZZZZ